MNPRGIDRKRISWARTRTLGVAFGDRNGLLVFLASLCFFGLLWRTTFLINDTFTLVNGLYALEHGSLHLTEAAYGPSLDTPGTTYHGGLAFARNFGVLVLALPVLFALEAVEAVADLRIALVASWSLLVLATVLLVGRILDYRREARIGGSVAVLLVFVANVALATPLSSPGNHLLALQIVHMVGAAFVGVFTYRLVSKMHDARPGFLAAVLVTFGTPLGFWASVPKRHVVTAAVVLGVAFAVARSRDPEDPHSTAARAIAYALVGFLAWVHAPEALVLFLALVAVDVPTAPTNDRRTLAIVGGAFALSLVPMMATNFAISGNPVKVPRAMSGVQSGADVSLSGSSSGWCVDRNCFGGGFGGQLGQIVVLALGLAHSALEPLFVLFGLLFDGARSLFRDPGDVYITFVRSGYVEEVADRAQVAPAANLSLLESAPVLGGVLALAPAVSSTVRNRLQTTGYVSHASAADLFLVLFATGYSLLYISALPIHAQVTVRYLFPLYPIGVYGLVRLSSVERSLTEYTRTFVWTYAIGVAIGGQLLLVALVSLTPILGEAFQFHALVALAIAGVVGLWAVTGRSDGRWGRFGAASIGLATAAGTTFVLFAALEYYALSNTHALPMMRVLGEVIDVL